MKQPQNHPVKACFEVKRYIIICRLSLATHVSRFHFNGQKIEVKRYIIRCRLSLATHISRFHFNGQKIEESGEVIVQRLKRARARSFSIFLFPHLKLQPKFNKFSEITTKIFA